MEMKLILDTTAYVGFKRNIVDMVNMIINADHIIFSPIVLGELMFGFRNCSKFKKNISDLNTFLVHESVTLVEIGKITADRFSRIATQLKRQGTPIPSNDMWLAAQAMEHGAELVTMDRHFEKIPGLIFTLF